MHYFSTSVRLAGFFREKNTAGWLLICSERKVPLVANKASEQDAYAYIFK
jgi:hypothetical protein